jgi:outer membrane protein W
MKKILFLFYFMSFVFVSQGQHLSKNSVLISLGIGTPNAFKDTLQNQLQLLTSAIDSAATTQTNNGPFCLKLATSVHKRVSLGLNLNVIGNNIIRTNPFDGSGNLLYLNAMLRSNYYLPAYKILHPYVGAGLGFGRSVLKYPNNNINNSFRLTTSYFNYEVSAGLKAYINKNIGIYIETSIGVVPFQMGFCFHLR